MSGWEHDNQIPFSRTVYPSRPRAGIDDLPDEILLKIYKLCIEIGTELGLRETRLTLLGVCRRWYNVTTAYSRFWTTIWPGWIRPSLIAIWLQRSQPHLLTIHTGPTSDLDPPEFFGRRNNIFELFLGEIHRWEKATLTLGVFQMTGLLRSLQPESAFHLLSLELNLRECSDGMIIQLGQAIDAACPNLVELKVHARCDDETVFDNFPIHRLSTISFNSPLPSLAAVDLMSRCLCASSLFIWISIRRGPEVEPRLVTIPLPTLTALNMYLSVDPVPVLRCFHLPALKSLEYKVDGWPRYQKTVPKYFAEAEFKLTRLRISDQRLNEDLAYAVAHAPPLHEAQDVHIEYSEPVKRPKIWDTYPLEGDGPPWLHWARTERIPDVDQLIDTAHLTFDQQLLDPTDTLLQGLDGFV